MEKSRKDKFLKIFAKSGGKMGKKTIFICLKLLELIGVGVVLVAIWFTGKFLSQTIFHEKTQLSIISIIYGLLFYMGIFLIFILGFYLWELLKEIWKINWEWTDKLYNKFIKKGE